MAATATARKYIDNAPTPTLTGAINGTVTVVTLSSLVGLPTSYPYFATLDLGTATAEVVKVTGTPGTNQLTITRNANGLGVYSHSASGTFDHTLTAADLQDANDHSVATGGVHGVSGSVVGTTDVQTLTNKTLTSPAFDSVTQQGFLQPGIILQYGGFAAPSGFLLCRGGNVSRTTFSALKSAITISVSGTTANGSTTLTVPDTTGIGVGWPVEGTGIPAGTTVAGAANGTQLILTAAATATGTNTVTIFPFGNGNGSTTFTLPQMQDNVGVGAGNLYSLGKTGGATQHSHTLAAGYAQVALATNNLGFKSATSAVASWTGDFQYAVTRAADGTTRTTGAGLGGATDLGSSLPPYMAFNYIIKT